MADLQEGMVSQQTDTLSEETSDEKKATVDTGKITPPSSKAFQKVELDLEDASFLEDDEEDEEERDTSQDGLSATRAATQPSPLWKRKSFILGGLAVLTGILVIAWMLLKPAPVPPPPQEEEHTAPPLEGPPQETPPELAEYSVSFEPFWVAVVANGTCRFLTCRFSFPVKGDLLKFEVDQKRIFIRDAVYYYFKNKDLLFLGNADNADKLKNDLLDIINQYLGNGQLDEILIQEYKVE